MMEWGVDDAAIIGGGFVSIGGGGEEEGMAEGALGLVNVMTEEQIEVLRVQISAYAAICEGLVAMHNAAAVAEQELFGVNSTMSSVYPDPVMVSRGPKISSKQRWAPTPVQLQILERMFSQGIGTPSKQNIKDITYQLSLHGQISEANVYNWFQNKRARLKRKMQNNPELKLNSKTVNTEMGTAATD